MIIPMRRPPSGDARALPVLKGARSARKSAESVGVHALVELSTRVASLLRVLVLLVCVMALFLPSADRTVVALALVLVLTTTTIGAIRYGPPLLLFALDWVLLLLLLYGTGGITSPLLPFTLLLVPLGALTGGLRDALAGGGAGLIVLLLLVCLQPHAPAPLLPTMLVLQTSCAAGVAWLAARAADLVNTMRDVLDREPQLARETGRLRLAAGWLRANRQIDDAPASDVLKQTLVELATAITGAEVTLEVASAHAASHPARGALPTISVGAFGQLVIHRATGELDLAQQLALEHLAALASTRGSVLKLGTERERRLAALGAVLQSAGVLRSVQPLQDALTNVLSCVARSLTLEWLALVGSDQDRGARALMTVRGTATTGVQVPSLQLRMSAEVLRSGRMLVSQDDTVALYCIPVTVSGTVAFVLAARGPAGDETDQTLLLLLSDLLGQRISSDRQTHRAGA